MSTGLSSVAPYSRIRFIPGTLFSILILVAGACPSAPSHDGQRGQVRLGPFVHCERGPRRAWPPSDL